MRLIDADHLAQIICSATILSDGFKDVFRKLVAGEPTIDRPTRSQFKRMAVQLGYEKVVHCKHCVYWGSEETKVATEYQLFCVCDAMKRQRKAGNCMTNEDFFCAHGERRTDENEPLGT